MKKVKKAKLISKIRPKKKKLKAAATTRRVKKKTKKKRKARPPVDEAEILRLGLECENRAEADAANRTRKSLAELFRKYPQLKQAWDRGRFLRSLRGLARTTISVSDAAKKLGFANGQVLRAMIDEDGEVGELWNETRLEVKIEFNAALFDEAKGGNPAAIKAIQQNFLLDEKEPRCIGRSNLSHITILQLAELTGKTRQTIHNWHTKFGLPRNADKTFDLSIFLSWHKEFLHKKTSGLTIFQLTEITGKTRQTIYDWHTKFGLPRNADKTFDLSIFLAWHEKFLLKKASMEKKLMAMLDPLRAAKVEMIKLEIARLRNKLLDRSEIITGLVARTQIIKSHCERGVWELTRLCHGQTHKKIAEIHRKFFRDLYTKMSRIPRELRLPPAEEKQLVDFFQRLKGEGYEKDSFWPTNPTGDIESLIR